MPRMYAMLRHALLRCEALRQQNVVRRGSAYSLAQSDTEWNVRSPTSANTPRCTPAMAAGQDCWAVECLALEETKAIWLAISAQRKNVSKCEQSPELFSLKTLAVEAKYVKFPLRTPDLYGMKDCERSCVMIRREFTLRLFRVYTCPSSMDAIVVEVAWPGRYHRRCRR
jgi:hypothetical protein